MITVDPYGEVTPYKQIAEQLRAKIVSGELSPGARLPSESELISSLGVARLTVRRALAVLEEEGLTVAEHGRGVFVRKPTTLLRVSGRRFAKEARETSTGAFGAETKLLGMTPRQHVREIKKIKAPPLAQAHLNLTATDFVIVRRRVMFADDVAMQIADSYYPATIAAGTAITEEDTGPGGSYSRLADLGYAPVRAIEELSARMPRPAERSTLGLPKGVPVIALIRTAFDADDLPVEVFDSVAAADKHVFLYEVPFTA